MLKNDASWGKVKNWAKWANSQAQFEIVLTGAIFPIFEGILGNILTGKDSGDRWVFVFLLCVVVWVHALILLITLFRTQNNLLLPTLDAVELQMNSQAISKRLRMCIVNYKTKEPERIWHAKRKSIGRLPHIE